MPAETTAGTLDFTAVPERSLATLHKSVSSPWRKSKKTKNTTLCVAVWGTYQKKWVHIFVASYVDIYIYMIYYLLHCKFPKNVAEPNLAVFEGFLSGSWGFKGLWLAGKNLVSWTRFGKTSQKQPSTNTLIWGITRLILHSKNKND